MSQTLHGSTFPSSPRRWALAAALGAAACLFGPALTAQVRVPGFKPSSSGLHFANNFPEIPLLKIDILGNQVPIGNAANGLCGGMVHAVQDYYLAGRLPPPDVTSGDGLARPPQILFDYLVKRLFDSFELPGGPLKYMHLMNPDLPDHETDFSRAGLAPHGRAWVMIVEEWPRIKADLDLGVLSSMAFIRLKSHDPFDMGQNHQILAYGYDLNGTDLTIHVYDPNYPGRDDVTMSLSLADPQHTTPVTYSMGDTMYCFFHTGYVFDNPPVTPCSTTSRESLDLHTGVDEFGQLISNGLADTAFRVTDPAGSATCATVVPDDDFPIGPWAATSTGSKWIGLRKRSSNGPPGRYSFLTRVVLPASANMGAMGLAGQWSADDFTADVLVNGASTGISGPGDFTALHPFPPGAGLGLFHAGENTVEFLVDNGDTGGENPIGLRVEASVAIIGQVDLVVSQVSANPAAVLPGGSLAVDFTDSNQGALACGLNLTRFQLTPTGGGAPVDLGYVQVPALCAGCATNASHTLTVPAGTAPGTYTIGAGADRVGACADFAGVILESNNANNCREGNAVLVQGTPPPAECHREDFSGRLLRDWEVASGDWRVAAGKLGGTGANDEAWIWSSSVVAAAPGGESYSFDLELFEAGGDPAVGRHGGVMFCSTSPTSRMEPSASGYTLDWIDREEDHGLRLMRIDHGVATPLQVGTPQLTEPPANWRITLDSGSIQVSGDGVPYMQVADATYRGGSFGVWAYVGDAVRIDNLSFGNGCGGARRPFDLTQDGKLGMSDCINLLGFLYLGKPSQLPCGDGTSLDPANRMVADYNGDGDINIADPIAALSFLFLGGPPPHAGLACVPIVGCQEVAGACVDG